jgi:microcystin-dependent protein
MARTEIELIKNGKVVREDLTDGLIDTSKLDTDAITTIKIKDAQITPAKLSASVGNTFFPIGGIIMWSGSPSTIPADWRLCDGNNSTPDLRGRFVVGASATGGYTVSDIGGSDQVTLTESQLASHTHSDGTYGTDSHTHQHSSTSDNSTLALNTYDHTHGAGTYESSDNTHEHVHQVAVGGGTDTGSGLGVITSMASGNTETDTHSHDVAGVSDSNNHNHVISGNTGTHTHSHDITGASGTSGSSQPHENRPPFYALAFIMKIA